MVKKDRNEECELPTKKAVQAALKELGATVDEIRKSLRRRRCKGLRYSSGNCPIAVYLQRKYALRAVNLSVGPRSISMRPAERTPWEWVIQTPDEIAGLIKTFDAGEYPKLIAELGT